MICTFIFGGAVCAVENFYGQLPIAVIAGVGSIIYFMIKFLISLKRKEDVFDGFLHDIKIIDHDVTLNEKAFLDSGNMLYDPITNKPVILISYEVFSKIYNIPKSAIISKTFNECSIKNGHYIKINSIGNGTRILVFSVDEIFVDEKKYFKDVMIGLSFSGFERSFGRGVLLHSEFV